MLQIGNGCVYTCLLSRLSLWPQIIQFLHGAQLSEVTDWHFSITSFWDGFDSGMFALLKLIWEL